MVPCSAVHYSNGDLVRGNLGKIHRNWVLQTLHFARGAPVGRSLSGPEETFSPDLPIGCMVFWLDLIVPLGCIW